MKRMGRARHGMDPSGSTRPSATNAAATYATMALASGAICLLAILPARGGEMPSNRWDLLQELQDNLAQEGVPLSIATVIPDLHAAYGGFGDVDGDGHLDYVATEMGLFREEVQIYMNRPRRGRRDDTAPAWPAWPNAWTRAAPENWRRTDRAFRTIRGRHPLSARIVEQAGSHDAAVLVETGGAPFWQLFPISKAGRFRGAPLALEKHLPPRTGTSRNVGDMPYRVSTLTRGGGRIRIAGRTLEPGKAALASADFALLVEGRKCRRVDGATRRRRFDPRDAPTTVTPAPVRSFESDDRDSPLPTTVVARVLTDINRDGIPDWVLVTADFAAHAFLGQVDPDGKGAVARTRRSRPTPVATGTFAACASTPTSGGRST